MKRQQYIGLYCKDTRLQLLPADILLIIIMHPCCHQFFTVNMAIICWMTATKTRLLSIIVKVWKVKMYRGSKRLCVCDISYSFLPVVFKFTHMMTMDKDLELSNFSWPWLNFQGHMVSLCFKLLYVIFHVVLCWWLSH